MKTFLVGWFAVALALLWDRCLFYVGLKEEVRVGVFVPVSEELLKFTVCYYFNLIPFLLYGVFGFGEGLYETIHLKQRFDFVLIFMGILTHVLFGIFFALSIPAWLSLSLAISMHLIWNQVILYRKNGCNNRSK